MKKLIEFPKGRTGNYDVPNGVEIIGQYSLNTCLLDSIYLPDSVITIEWAALAGYNFKSLTLPNSIKTIAGYAFGKKKSGDEVIYKGTKYTSKSALTAALKANGVSVHAYAWVDSNLAD